MPTYEYQCDKCDHNFEIVKSFNDSHKKKCPECGKLSLYQVISPPTVFVKGEATTLGQISDRNTEKMGRYELEDKRASQDKGNLKKKKKKERDSARKEINKMTREQKANYIRDGKK